MTLDVLLNLIDKTGSWEKDRIKSFIKETGRDLSESVRLCHDSRMIGDGEIYVAIKGEHSDGHDFVNQAFENGAVLAFVQQKRIFNGPCIYVEDVVLFLNELATDWFSQVSPFTIAITGSNGKSTTKEWVKTLMINNLGEKAVFANAGNMNTEIGLPISLINDLKMANKYAIIEMGMGSIGDIDFLSRRYRPDVACVLNIGTAHIGNTGGLQETLKEKAQIFENSKEDGVLFSNISDTLLSKKVKQDASGREKIWFGDLKDRNDEPGAFLEDYKVNPKNGYFETEIRIRLFEEDGIQSERFDIRIKGLFHRGSAYNLCSSIAIVAKVCDFQRSKEQLSDLTIMPGRFEPIPLKKNLLISDFYNSSIESLHYALDCIHSIIQNGPLKKIYCVLGSISETGHFNTAFHRKIGEILNSFAVEGVFLYVKDRSIEQAAETYKGDIYQSADKVEMVTRLNNAIQEETESVFLFKASRSIEMEEVFNDVLASIS